MLLTMLGLLAREGATLVVVGADEAPPQPHGRQYAHRTVL